MRNNAMEIFSVAGIIGLVVVGVTAFGYVYSVITGHEAKVPEWLSMAVGTVIGYFYGQRTRGDNGVVKKDEEPK